MDTCVGMCARENSQDLGNEPMKTPISTESHTFSLSVSHISVHAPHNVEGSVGAIDRIWGTLQYYLLVFARPYFLISNEEEEQNSF